MAAGDDIRLFKVWLSIGGKDVQSCDGIAWKGKLWLVPVWLDEKATGAPTPARIIRFDSLRHDTFRDGYAITDPLPKELFDLSPRQQSVPGYEYIDLPGLSLPAGQKPH